MFQPSLYKNKKIGGCMILKTMKFSFYFLFLIVSLANAETSKKIIFENQRDENFQLENWLKETLYKTEEVPSTCYRDISVVENVCRTVTKYRDVCRTIPGQNVCHTEYDQQCRYETRYENVCHNLPSRQDCRVVVRYRQECSGGGRGERQCRTIPGDVVCRRMPNGENRCEKIPPREVCQDGPSTPRECRQVPYEERECRTIPGERVCRTEPRQEQVCHQVPRSVCHYEPARNVCESIPYQENVCGMETVVKKEAYACLKTIQVPYEKVTKTHQADIEFLFGQNSNSSKFEINTVLTTLGEVKISSKNLGNPKHFLFFENKMSQSDSGEMNQIKSKVYFKVLSIEEELTATADGIFDVELTATDLKFKVNGKFNPSRTLLKLNIRKKDETKFNANLKHGQYTTQIVGNETVVRVDLKAQGAPKLGGVFNRTHDLSIELSSDYSDLSQNESKSDSIFIISKQLSVKID